MLYHTWHCRLTATLCAFLLVSGSTTVYGSEPASLQGENASAEAPKIPNDQLDSLVAPIALYPDPLLAQVLAASTYPLELIQLQQWLTKNKGLKDQALVDAVQKQPWDASVQAMAAIPDVVKRLTDDIQWTTDLGNAFLAQQSDLMDAVQRMRKKAEEKGNLKSNEQQKVETKVVESKEVIVIEQSSPQVVYVPSYNPTVVYGPPAYPYPPVAYPPPGYYAAGMAISFGIGVAMGAAWGGGWGWGCGWGGNNDITINNNNNFVNNSNRAANISNRSGNSTWQHNSKHRGGAPYSNRATAAKYGGATRGDSMSNRQARARQNQSQRGDRQGSAFNDRGSTGDRRPEASTRDRASSGGRQQTGGGDRTAGRNGQSRGGGDRVGNRSVSGGSARGSSSAFGGGGGFSGSSARSSSSRGSSS